MILDDPSLTNVDRMHYLYLYLTEKASNALNNLPIINSNFPIVWNTFVSRRRINVVYNTFTIAFRLYRRSRQKTPTIFVPFAIKLITQFKFFKISITLSNTGMLVFLVAQKQRREGPGNLSSVIL